MTLLRTLFAPFIHHALRASSREEGFSTAELLGNAALGIAALVAIWAVLQALGVNVVSWIQGQILGG